MVLVCSNERAFGPLWKDKEGAGVALRGTGRSKTRVFLRRVDEKVRLLGRVPFTSKNETIQPRTLGQIS